MNKKNALLLIGVVMSVSVLAAGCTSNVGNMTSSPSPTSTTPSLTNTYDSVKGFTIKYPSDWVKEEPKTGDTVRFWLPTNNSTENLNVAVQNLSAGATLGAVTDIMTLQRQNYSDFQQVSSVTTKLAGQPAAKLVYTATVDGNQLKLLQTWTMKDGKAYVITYQAAPRNYDTYVSTAQQMIDSFQIK